MGYSTRIIQQVPFRRYQELQLKRAQLGVEGALRPVQIKQKSASRPESLSALLSLHRLNTFEVTVFYTMITELSRSISTNILPILGIALFGRCSRLQIGTMRQSKNLARAD